MSAVALLCSLAFLMRNGHRQICCSGTSSWIDDSSARDLSVVIYVFGAFEMSSKAAFEIVEVRGCIAVIPNDGTTINKVRVA
jgi:hypothetical protein